MLANTVEVLDIYVKKGSFTAIVDRYETPGGKHAEGNIVLSWNPLDKPEGFLMIGDGVAFIRTENNSSIERIGPSNSGLDIFGSNEFAWRHTAHWGLFAIIVILPEGYVVANAEDIYPTPIQYKVFKGRMAFYWELTAEEKNVRWKIQKIGRRNIDKLCAALKQRQPDQAQAHGESKRLVSKDGPSTTIGNIMAVFEKLVEVLPRIKTKIQLIGLIVIVGGVITTRSLAPEQLPVAFIIGGVGILFVAYAQIFPSLKDFPENQRVFLILVSLAMMMAFFTLLGWIILTHVNVPPQAGRLTDNESDRYLVKDEHLPHAIKPSTASRRLADLAKDQKELPKIEWLTSKLNYIINETNKAKTEMNGDATSVVFDSKPLLHRKQHLTLVTPFFTDSKAMRFVSFTFLADKSYNVKAQLGEVFFDPAHKGKLSCPNGVDKDDIIVTCILAISPEKGSFTSIDPASFFWEVE